MPAAKPIIPGKAFQIGEVWVDPQGRQHRVGHCTTEGLVTLTPIEGKLEPIAMAIREPYPWRRVTA